VSTGEKYLAGAYVVVLAAVLAWVAIVSLKLARLERDLDELARLAARRREQEQDAEREEAAKPPVRVSGPLEGVRESREVPPAARSRGGRG
jgi:hypothetical protein